MKQAGIALLLIGFFGASFVAVRELDTKSDGTKLEWQTVNWLHYGGFIALGVVGVVLIRTAAAGAKGETHVVAADLQTMKSSIEDINRELAEMVAARETMNVYDVHERIDAQMATQLAAFADARESLITAYGLQPFADVMTQFATGERAINRAWSASADGYVNEVWNCLERASGFMQKAAARLTELAAQ